MATKNKADIRRGVHSRIRKKVRGSAARPRLAVFRSLNHIYAQLIDDDSGKTLATASTTEKSLGGATGGNISAAQQVGIARQVLADSASCFCSTSSPSIMIWISSLTTNLPSSIMLKFKPNSFLFSCP